MMENSCDLNTMITWDEEMGTTALQVKQESSSSESGPFAEHVLEEVTPNPQRNIQI